MDAGTFGPVAHLDVTDGAEQGVSLETITEFDLGLGGPVLDRRESGPGAGVHPVVDASA